MKNFFIIIFIIFLISINVWYFSKGKNDEMVWGVTFSAMHARDLGLDVGVVFTTILDEWKFRHLRLIAQWDELEKEKGKFDFSQMDYLMNEAAKRQAKVILAIGQKTPRWPECNIPDWSKELSDADYDIALQNYLKMVVSRYAHHSALEIWQVENEPFLGFGEKCRAMTTDKLQTEILLVKNLDNIHPILITDSGELSTWRKTLKAGDLFGTTAYRVVWNKYFGYFKYDWLPAGYYTLRANLFGKDLSQVQIVELQAEPWVPDQRIAEDNIAEQFKSMDLDRLKSNIEFARNTGFGRSYFWGAEWWYWLKIHNQNEISNFLKTLPID